MPSSLILPITPISSSPRWLTPAFCVAAVSAIIGASLGGGVNHGRWIWLYWICKPLATGLVFTMVWRTFIPVSLRYRRRILAGVVFSWVGDVFLMCSESWFMAGLLSFLLAHLCFIAAFIGDKPPATKLWPWLACLVYGAVAMCLLWPRLSSMLRVAVLVYIVVLATMGGQAMGRAQWLHDQYDVHMAQARVAAVGALFFVLSDSLLAWNKFMGRLPQWPIWVLGTYYLAIWLIGRSVGVRLAATTRGQVQ